MSKGITQADFARLCGVTPQCVSQWVKNGRIRKNAHGRIDPADAMRMREATESAEPHHQARKAQIEAEKAEQRAAPPPMAEQQSAMPGSLQGVEKISAALKLETYKLQKAKAEKAQMEADEKAGALLDRKEVEAIWDETFTILRTLHESLPDRLAGALSAHRGDTAAIHRSLEDAAAEILQEVSSTMNRKMEGV